MIGGAAAGREAPGGDGGAVEVRQAEAVRETFSRKGSIRRVLEAFWGN